MDELPRCRPAAWSDVERWTAALETRIRAADAVPETIVGLTRGGWVPARLLGDRLGVKRLVSLRAQHWGVTARPDGVAAVTEGLSGTVRGQRVLVVDDITDTGESLALALEHVRRDGPARALSATFLHIAGAKFAPEFFGEEIARDHWVWVVFPWNYWEDLAALAERAARATPGLDAVRATLKERCGLAVPRADLERIAGRVPLG